MATIEKFCAPSVYNSPMYSQGIKVAGAKTFLFISGQVACDEHGNVTQKGDFRGQARAVLRNLSAMVEAGGGTLADVVKLNIYLTNIRYRDDWIAIRNEFFSNKVPAATTIETPALAHPDLLIEVEAIAAL